MVLPVDEIALTPQQEAIVSAFQKQFPEASRFTAVKFCYGRKFELQRVFPLYQAYKAAVKERGLESLTTTDILPELKTQKMYIPGARDKRGAALFIVQASKHVPGQFAPEQTIRLAFYLGEVITSNAKTQACGVTLLLNLDGMEWATFDAAFMSEVIGFFQNRIPAAVKNILIWRAPWWIRSAVKVVAPFLKEKMRKRIQLCDNLFALESFVARDQLPVEFGGSLEYDHGYFIRRELSKASAEDVLAALTATSAGAADAGLAAASARPLVLDFPPEAMLLVASAEEETQLQQERSAAIAALDDQITRVLEGGTVGEHGYPLAMHDIMHNRALRLRLDVAVLAATAQVVGPACLSRRSTADPLHRLWLDIEAVTDEKERLRQMQAALVEDRLRYLKAQDTHA